MAYTAAKVLPVVLRLLTWSTSPLCDEADHSLDTLSRASIYRAPMLYRVRCCAAVPEKLAAFHDFFNGYLLPIQVRHGARLVGRWETDDEEVIAVWEYDDIAAYERIDAAIRADPDSVRAQKQPNALGPLFTEKHETFARSTVQSVNGQRGASPQTLQDG